jgi:hypothetical protein
MSAKFQGRSLSRERSSALSGTAAQEWTTAALAGGKRAEAIYYYDLTEDHIAGLDRCYERLQSIHLRLRRRQALVAKVVTTLLPLSMLLLAAALAGSFFTLPLEAFLGAAALALVPALLLHRLYLRYEQRLDDHLQQWHDLYACYLDLLRTYEIVAAQRRGETIESLLKQKFAAKKIFCE